MRSTPRRTRRSLLSLCVIILAALAACSREPAGGSTAGGEVASTPGGTASAPAPSLANPALDLEPVMTFEAQAVFERSCKNCHGPDGHGIAAVAPDLRRSPRRTAEEWEKYLRDPQSVHPNAQMPAIQSMTDEDYEAVGAYLADLTQHNPPPAATPAK
jgi:mono/diheme cytochrome c family protein